MDTKLAEFHLLDFGISAYLSEDPNVPGIQRVSNYFTADFPPLKRDVPAAIEALNARKLKLDEQFRQQVAELDKAVDELAKSVDAAVKEQP